MQIDFFFSKSDLLKYYILFFGYYLFLSISVFYLPLLRGYFPIFLSLFCCYLFSIYSKDKSIEVFLLYSVSF